jgi:hypothetical protein
LNKVLHVETLTNEPAGIRNDEAEVCANELVDRSLGLTTTAGKCAARTRIAAAGTKCRADAIKEGSLEALDAQLGSDARAAATNALTSGIVSPRGPQDCGSRRTLEKTYESLDMRGRIRVFRRVPQHRRRQKLSFTQIHRQRPKWRG